MESNCLQKVERGEWEDFSPGALSELSVQASGSIWLSPLVQLREGVLRQARRSGDEGGRLWVDRQGNHSDGGGIERD